MTIEESKVYNEETKEQMKRIRELAVSIDPEEDKSAHQVELAFQKHITNPVGGLPQGFFKSVFLSLCSIGRKNHPKILSQFLFGRCFYYVISYLSYLLIYYDIFTI